MGMDTIKPAPAAAMMGRSVSKPVTKAAMIKLPATVVDMSEYKMLARRIIQISKDQVKLPNIVYSHFHM